MAGVAVPGMAVTRVRMIAVIVLMIVVVAGMIVGSCQENPRV